MPIRNYRQAKRNREDARKKRQQQKLDRKLNRGPADPAPEAPATPPSGSAEETP